MAKDIDLIAALADAHLSDFDQKQVIRSAVALFGTDGLSEAMAVDPIEIPLGSTGTMVIRWTCAEVKLKPVSKDTPELVSRNHRLKVDVMAFADSDAITSMLNEQEERIRVAKDAAKGIQSLPLTGDPDDDGGFKGSEAAAAEAVEAVTRPSRARKPAPPIEEGVTQSGTFAGEPYDATKEVERVTRRSKRTPAADKAPAGTMPENVPDNVRAIRTDEGVAEHGG